MVLVRRQNFYSNQYLCLMKFLKPPVLFLVIFLYHLVDNQCSWYNLYIYIYSSRCTTYITSSNMHGVLWLITFLADWQLISCLKVSIITVLWWLHREPLVSRGMTLSLVWEKMLDWVHKLRDLCGQGPQMIINSRNEAGRGYELVLAPVCSHAPRCGLLRLTCQLNLQQNAL